MPIRMPPTEKNFLIYQGERHCENCAKLADCWNVVSGPITRRVPGMFFPKIHWNWNRVEHFLKRNIAGCCEQFVCDATKEMRVFGQSEEKIGWDK